MELKTLSTALIRMEHYGLDGTDLVLLDEFCSLYSVGRVPVMELISKSNAASHATVHARIKKLVKANVLSKEPDTENLRIKYLKPGDRWVDIMDEIQKV